jgi:hypothetical protein
MVKRKRPGKSSRNKDFFHLKFPPYQKKKKNETLLLPGDAILRTIFNRFIDLVPGIFRQVHDLYTACFPVIPKDLRGKLYASFTAAASPQINHGKRFFARLPLESILHFPRPGLLDNDK